MKQYRLRLHHYIILVAFLSFVLAIASTTWSSYQINTQTLKDNTLETNRVYAEKLAQTTDTYFNSALQMLSYSAGEMSGFMKDETKIKHEANRLKDQIHTFNSILVTDGQGKILTIAPENPDLINQILSTEGGKQALAEKRPIISTPYTSLTGKQVIFVSVPIFDVNQNYLGLVGGLLYLKEFNVLHEILGEHFYQDGSYVYVVDQNGQIIYHQDKNRVLSDVSRNEVVQKVLRGEHGASQVINSLGIDMLSGYAPISIANWGIVAQRETAVSLQPAEKMLKTMFMTSLPLLIISLFVLFFISRKIARPLNQLAHYAEISTDKNQEADLDQINTFYYEAVQLKKALLNSFAYLHNQMNHFMEQSTTDLLTGLHNRRVFNEKTNKWIENETPFAMVFIDIDNFKKVNDTFGHNVGDQVLQFLAIQMVDGTRPQDACCRYGGEEFIILLPETSEQDARLLANQFRETLSEKISPSGEIITISGGISYYPQDGYCLEDLTAKADARLYQAKSEGKNRIL